MEWVSGWAGSLMGAVGGSGGSSERGHVGMGSGGVSRRPEGSRTEGEAPGAAPFESGACYQ